MNMKITDIKKLTDYHHLNLFCTTYTDRRKIQKQWIFASRSNLLPTKPDPQHNRPDAVVIVPFHMHEKKLVLIKEFRVALGEYQYGFPAGLVDEGESIEACGTRELFEETGLKIIRVRKKSPVVFSSSGLTDESVLLLFVECEGKPTKAHNEASEDIEVLLLSQQQSLDLLEDRQIKFDVKTWIVLNQFAATGAL